MHRLLSYELHWFKMRVELVDHGQRFPQEVLDNVTHGDVVRQAYLLADADELAAPRDWQHLEGQRPAEAEAGAPRGEPEGDLLRLVLAADDLERRLGARLAQVPVLLRAVVAQHPHQPRDVDVVVVVEVAEPLLVALQEGVQLHRELAAERSPVVRRRAVGVDHVAVCLPLELRVVRVREEPRLVLGELEPGLEDDGQPPAVVGPRRLDAHEDVLQRGGRRLAGGRGGRHDAGAADGQPAGGLARGRQRSPAGPDPRSNIWRVGLPSSVRPRTTCAPRLPDVGRRLSETRGRKTRHG